MRVVCVLCVSVFFCVLFGVLFGNFLSTNRHVAQLLYQSREYRVFCVLCMSFVFLSVLVGVDGVGAGGLTIRV